MGSDRLRVTICGAAGRMGKANLEVFTESQDTIVVGAIESEDSPYIGKDAGSISGLDNIGTSITSTLESIIEDTDVVVDFTTVSATLAHMRVAIKHKKAIVIGTTGFNDEQLALIRKYAKEIPILLSPNMSPGVNTLFYLVGKAAALLGEEFDVEILEIHHNKKTDAPSGTALQFGRIIADARGKEFTDLAVYKREGVIGERRKGEIGIMALRAADIIGDHTILFGGAGERIEFTHRSSSRQNYATGALRATRFLSGKKNGFYTMADVLGLHKI
jgi:4-hydroxy-tetrahydrodipicolinate reductase